MRDNIRWGKENATDDEIDSALKIAQIYDTVYEKDGLDTVIEHGGGNLSGGQKQRLSVARALVGKPQIIVLDDSASALDFATEKAMREAILSLDYKPTLFIVSQRCSSILTADKILVLDDGKCVGMGTSEELLKTCEVYREIYSSQFDDNVGRDALDVPKNNVSNIPSSVSHSADSFPPRGSLDRFDDWNGGGAQ